MRQVGSMRLEKAPKMIEIKTISKMMMMMIMVVVVVEVTLMLTAVLVTVVGKSDSPRH